MSAWCIKQRVTQEFWVFVRPDEAVSLGMLQHRGYGRDSFLTGLWLIHWWFWTALAAGDRDGLDLCQANTANIIFTKQCLTTRWKRWTCHADLGCHTTKWRSYFENISTKVKPVYLRCRSNHMHACNCKKSYFCLLLQNNCQNFLKRRFTYLKFDFRLIKDNFVKFMHKTRKRCLPVR